MPKHRSTKTTSASVGNGVMFDTFRGVDTIVVGTIYGELARHYVPSIKLRRGPKKGAYKSRRYTLNKTA